MAPKGDKAKGKAVKSAEALRLEALRKETATFPPQLDAVGLRDKYRLFWSTKTRAHPRTRVLPADAQKQYPAGYPFFDGVVKALQHLRIALPKELADETREAISGALRRVLVKIVFRNPDIRLANVLRPLPENADLTGIQALIAPIVKKAAGVRRIEGDRVD